MSSDRVAENGQNARLLRALVWAGVSLAPVAALVVLVGDSQGPMRFGVLLVAVCVVLVGASLLLRNDPVLLRMHVEDTVADELAVLREELRSEIAAVRAQPVVPAPRPMPGPSVAPPPVSVPREPGQRSGGRVVAAAPGGGRVAAPMTHAGGGRAMAPAPTSGGDHATGAVSMPPAARAGAAAVPAAGPAGAASPAAARAAAGPGGAAMPPAARAGAGPGGAGMPPAARGAAGSGGAGMPSAGRGGAVPPGARGAAGGAAMPPAARGATGAGGARGGRAAAPVPGAQSGRIPGPHGSRSAAVPPVQGGRAVVGAPATRVASAPGWPAEPGDVPGRTWQAADVDDGGWLPAEAGDAHDQEWQPADDYHQGWSPAESDDAHGQGWLAADGQDQEWPAADDAEGWQAPAPRGRGAASVPPPAAPVFRQPPPPSQPSQAEPVPAGGTYGTPRASWDDDSGGGYAVHDSGDIYQLVDAEELGGVYGSARTPEGGKRRADETAVDLGYTGRRSKPEPDEGGGEPHGNGNYWEAGGYGDVDAGYPGWSEAEERYGQRW